MYCKFVLVCVLVLHVASLQGKAVNEKVLQLSHLTKCTYDYEVTVYTARGTESTLSGGYQVHALVRYSSVTLRRNIANAASFLFAMSRAVLCQCRGNRLFISVNFQKRRMKVCWAQNVLLLMNHSYYAACYYIIFSVK